MTRAMHLAMLALAVLAQARAKSEVVLIRNRATDTSGFKVRGIAKEIERYGAERRTVVKGVHKSAICRPRVCIDRANVPCMATLSIYDPSTCSCDPSSDGFDEANPSNDCSMCGSICPPPEEEGAIASIDEEYYKVAKRTMKVKCAETIETEDGYDYAVYCGTIKRSDLPFPESGVDAGQTYCFASRTMDDGESESVVGVGVPCAYTALAECGCYSYTEDMVRYGLEPLSPTEQCTQENCPQFTCDEPKSLCAGYAELIQSGGFVFDDIASDVAAALGGFVTEGKLGVVQKKKKKKNDACADDGGVSPIYGAGLAAPLLDQPYFDGAGEYQKLNLYPTSASDGAGAPKVPLAIFVHGGGWKSGSRYKIDERWDSLDLRYFGFAVASMGYRLSQAAPWPAQIDDLKAGVQWLYDHADDHGLDRDRFFVYGQSAGGHLALMLGLNHNEGGMLKATVDFYGPVGLSMYTDDSMDSSINQLLGCPAPDCLEQARDADPIVHLDGGDPPLLIIHGTDDTTVPITVSEGLYDLSSAAGIDVAMISTDGAGHAMGACLSPNKAWEFKPADSPAAAAANQTRAMLRWLNGRGLVLCGGD